MGIKVDFEAVLKDPKGQDFADKATLGVAVYSAFATPLQTDTMQEPAQRLALYRLMQKVGAGGVQELTIEEAATIKDRACKALQSLAAYGAIVDLLEKGAQ